MRIEDRWRLAAFVLCAVAIVLPLVAVSIPPITDLPQQVAQARLFFQVLENSDSRYVVQWWHPNTLGYLPLLAAWKLVSPLATGRIALVVLGLTWIVAIHAVSRAFGRPASTACLASLLFFNHVTYWGLMNFLSGFPVFLWWMAICEKAPPRQVSSSRWAIRCLLVMTLLYSAHILWLVAGLVWLTIRLPRLGATKKSSFRLGLWLSPLLLTVAFWYPSLISQGYTSDIWWGRSPLGRSNPEWMLNSALGGLAGHLEIVVGLIVAVWLVGGLVQHRHRLGEVTHRSLLFAGLGSLSVALVLPAVIQGTVLFASRWFPVAVILIILALPRPIMKRSLAAAFVGVVVLGFSFGTTSIWLDFERNELDGLPESLAALPTDQLILGLDFFRTSQRIKGYPFYHLYSYGQVVAGGEVYNSFANIATSLVVYRDPYRFTPWTKSLDWRATRVRASDVHAFDHVFVNGSELIHQRFLVDPLLEPVTAPAHWRLYRVKPSNDANETSRSGLRS